MSGLLRLLHAKRNPPALPTANFKNKSVLITGSNTGLGFAAAQHFLRLQATHVILAVRSLQKGEAAKSQLEQEFGKRGAVSVMHLDMNSFESVRDFAEEVGERSRSCLRAVLSGPSPAPPSFDTRTSLTHIHRLYDGASLNNDLHLNASLPYPLSHLLILILFTRHFPLFLSGQVYTCHHPHQRKVMFHKLFID